MFSLQVYNNLYEIYNRFGDEGIWAFVLSVMIDKENAIEESEALYEANQQMSDAASERQEAVGKMTGLSDAKLREHLYDAIERVLVCDSESIEIIWKFNEVKNGSSSYTGAGVWLRYSF